MRPRLNYCWRLGVTGACFFGFSATSVIFSAMIFPLLCLLVRDPLRRREHAQRFVHKSFGVLVGVLRRAGVMRLELAGAEQLRDARSVLVLANHPCLLDVVVLLAVIPRACCVVKTALWANPFLGGIVRAAGYIANSSPERVVLAAASALHEGTPLLMFPEGTRTEPGRPLRFLRGAAHVALASDRPIIPVLMSCDPPTLLKGSRWYQIPPQAFSIRVVVKPPLRASELTDAGAERGIAARRLTAALEAYFNGELSPR